MKWLWLGLPFVFLILEGCSRRAPSPAVALSQNEGWESSGGGGVACFESEASVQRADVLLSQGRGLTDELRRQITRVVPLDRWEYIGQKHFDDLSGLDRETILNRLDQRFLKYTPLFAAKLDLIKSRIDFSLWADDTELPPIHDARPRFDIAKRDPNCRLIQLAIRYTKSRAGYLPEIRVKLDRWLFDNRMTPLDQAILIKHEQFYLVARELESLNSQVVDDLAELARDPEIAALPKEMLSKRFEVFRALGKVTHRDSDVVRQVVIYFFSDEATQIIRAKEQKRDPARARGLIYFDPDTAAAQVRGPLGLLLGDYYFYFLRDPAARPAVATPGPGPYSRFVAFGAVLTKLRKRKAACFLKKDISVDMPINSLHQFLEECSAAAVQLDLIEPTLNAEEAFVALGRWLFDPYDVVETFENYVTWNLTSPNVTPVERSHEINFACGLLRVIRFPISPRLQAKALSYCAP